PVAICFGVFPKDVNNWKLGTLRVAWLRRRPMPGRVNESSVGTHRNFSATYPKAPAESDAMPRLLELEAGVIARRAAHIEAARWYPDVAAMVSRIELHCPSLG